MQHLLDRIFRYHRTDTAVTLRKVKFTTNFDEIDAVLRAHAPTAQRFLAAALNTSL